MKESKSQPLWPKHVKTEMDWMQNNCVHCFELKPLDFDAVSELVHCMTEGVLVSDSVIQYVHEKTNGIPLYVEQMVQYLKEQDLLESQTFSNGLVSNKGLMEFMKENVTIQQLLMEKLDQLKPTTHLTLKAALLFCKTVLLKA